MCLNRVSSSDGATRSRSASVTRRTSIVAWIGGGRGMRVTYARAGSLPMNESGGVRQNIRLEDLACSL